METGFCGPLLGAESVELEPNLIGWDGVELENESSANDDSLSDFFVLTRSNTIVGYAPAI